MSSEFDGSKRDELGRDLEEFLNPAKASPAEDAKSLADDRLFLSAMLNNPASAAARPTGIGSRSLSSQGLANL